MLFSRIDLSARRGVIPVAFLGLAWCAGGKAAEPGSFSFTPAAKYLPEVPTVPALTGFAVGERFVDHGMVGRVLAAIDGSSERIQVVRYGTTNEGRPLLLAIATTPENHARWPEIELGLRRLADPRLLGADPAAEREALIASLPVVVWLSFSVHGNESSGTEAALALLYHLAAAADPAVETMLRDAVIVIDPCLNPDGRDRYVHAFRARMGAEPNPDPQAAEHAEPWPGGRVNHYYFDLNRDWAFLTQVETRARLRQYRKYQPQVHADLHEMFPESTYFFFPAAPPIHDDLPRSTLEFGEVFGKANAAAFDRFGFAYYTAEEFDLFYPGYGDSWPSLNGAIGMTYEQGGHGLAGIAYERADGSILTLRNRAAGHFTAALTTASTGAQRRAELLRSYSRFHSDAFWEGERGAIKDFVLVPGSDAARVRDLVSLLIEQGVEVHRAPQGFTVERAHSFTGGGATERSFPPGSYVVRLAQPRRHLAKALLEPEGAVRENQFYDVSAWSLPFAFGVDAWWTEQAIGANLEAVSTIERTAAAQIDLDSGSAVGWLIPWDSFDAPRFLAAATRDGVRVRVATEPFTLDGVPHPRGTLYVARGGQRRDVDWKSAFRAALGASGVGVTTVTSTYAERGPDLGSDSFRALSAPSIAIATGEGMNANAVGALRWLLEARYGIPFTEIALDSLSRTDLRRYNVLVLADGFGSGALGGAKENLQRFASGGGVIVALGGSAFALGEGGIGLVGVKVAADPPATETKPEKPTWRLAAERRINALEENVPGTMFRLEFDPSHPLTYGYDGPIAVLMDSTRAFALDGPGSRMGVFPERSVLAGFASPASGARLDGKAYLADVSLGSGRVLLFAGDPTFRGFVRGQVGLLMNSILLFADALPPPAVQRVPR
jgi:Zinc carboxypeptidase